MIVAVTDLDKIPEKCLECPLKEVPDDALPALRK